jgi:hypothetical protein
VSILLLLTSGVKGQRTTPSTCIILAWKESVPLVYQFVMAVGNSVQYIKVVHFFFPGFNSCIHYIPRYSFWAGPAHLSADEFIEMINSGAIKSEFYSFSGTRFWVRRLVDYPALANTLLKILLPFPTA